MESFNDIESSLSALSPLELSVLESIVLERAASEFKGSDYFRVALLSALREIDPKIIPSKSEVKDVAMSRLAPRAKSLSCSDGSPVSMPVSKILRWPEVHNVTGLCRSHVHQMASKGEFPKPIKLGGRSSGWIESEIIEWINRRIAARSPLNAH